MHFVSLHNHSVFSFHAGVATVEELARRAKELGMTAMALTDTNRMSGLIRFYCACKDCGIKPILGVELTDPPDPENSVVCLSKNADGYADLCEIITNRHLKQDTFRFETAFAKPWPNLFFISSCPNVLVMLANTPNRENLYAEIVNNSRETRLHSRAVEQTAQQLHLPLVASNNTFFLDEFDWETHRILTAIGKTSTVSRLRPGEYASAHAFLRPHGDMARLFPNHPEAIANTARIADQCDTKLALGSWIMPHISVPGGATPAAHLRGLAYAGLEANFAKTPRYAEAKRIQDMELDVIEKLGYPSYFLIVKDIRDWAGATFAGGFRKHKDSTVLRGSAANSMTFYNLGVSDLDPIKYDLYFQRFLNEDRASPPDADLDFGWDERETALEHLVEKWGRDRVAITCTTNHFRRRAAFRETAKVFGYSEEQVTEILTSHKTQTKRIDDAEIQHLLALAEKIRGKPRFLGQHPGGVLITNQPIWRHVACEYSCAAAQDAPLDASHGMPKDMPWDNGRIITQIDMHNGIDELGLIKFDILGNGSLSVLRDVLRQLEAQGLPDPDVSDLDKCYNDPAVRDMIRNGRTRGIFYIESPAQMRLNKKAQADTFEEITMTSSLVRPAGASYTKTFVERHRKAKTGTHERDWDFLHPSLEPILSDTHDVCAYQEDVTKICHQVAGLSFKKADRIRKMMNSLHEGALSDADYFATAQEFMDGCRGHSGLTQAQALALWERVSSFTGFSFCKSHSASYAQLSFKCAWLKTHYPAQFLAGVVSNNHGFYSRDVYLDEARRFGVGILPISINHSDVKYSGKHNWMRVGLMHIRHLSQKTQDAIVFERRHAPFCNLINFVKRVHINKKEIENLILVGAFDGFGMSQPESLFLLDDIFRKLDPGAPSLFSPADLFTQEKLHPGLTDYTLAQKCLNELRILGFMVSGNILDILDLHPAHRGAVPADRIGAYKGKRIKMFGWPITNRLHMAHCPATLGSTRRGGAEVPFAERMKTERPMLFVTMEDKTECVDVILWPDVYGQYADVISGPGPFEVWGRVSEDYGTFTLEAQTIRSVQWSPGMVDFEAASERLKNSYKAADYVYADVKRTAA
jgi:DNA-directed DNA polymerase III PolC